MSTSGASACRFVIFSIKGTSSLSSRLRNLVRQISHLYFLICIIPQCARVDYVVLYNRKSLALSFARNLHRKYPLKAVWMFFQLTRRFFLCTTTALSLSCCLHGSVSTLDSRSKRFHPKGQDFRERIIKLERRTTHCRPGQTSLNKMESKHGKVWMNARATT